MPHTRESRARWLTPVIPALWEAERWDLTILPWLALNSWPCDPLPHPPKALGLPREIGISWEHHVHDTVIIVTILTAARASLDPPPTYFGREAEMGGSQSQEIETILANMAKPCLY
ncbi:hypothetical protein AAY473_007213 [Plecturocebus cupreus]